MHLQGSSKFLELLKSAGKRVLTSRDTCCTRRVPRGGSPGVGSRGTWRTRNAPGVILPVGALGTRGVSGEFPDLIGNFGPGRIGRAILAVGSTMDGRDQLGASSSLRGRQQGGVRRLGGASPKGSPECD